MVKFTINKVRQMHLVIRLVFYLRLYSLIIFFCTALCAKNSYAQNLNVKLSPRHVQKIEEATDPAKKLKKLHRFYHRDSLKQARALDKYWKAKTDSAVDAIVKRERAIAEREKNLRDGLNSNAYTTVYKPWAKKQAQQQIEWLDQQDLNISTPLRSLLITLLEEYFLEATQDESRLLTLEQRFPDIKFPKQLSTKLKNYKLIFPDKVDRALPYSDKLKELQLGQDNLQSIRNSARLDALKQTTAHTNSLSTLNNTQSQFNKTQGTIDQYKSQTEQAQDSAYIKEQAKKKAEEIAANYLAENPEVLRNAQRKMRMLMRKYSYVPNSNNLSTAVKTSSLKGRTFKERLMFAGNFQVLSVDPVSIDFSPQAGYRINKWLTMGIGGTYRQTFGEKTLSLAPRVFGYKAFVSYDLFSNFFVYSEFGRNTSGVETINDHSTRIWKNVFLAGAGRKFRVHKKIEMTTLVAYNFLHQYQDPVYPTRWVVRIGFQTSELAFLKRKPAY